MITAQSNNRFFRLRPRFGSFCCFVSLFDGRNKRVVWKIKSSPGNTAASSSFQKAPETKESESHDVRPTYAIQIGVFSKKMDGGSKVFKDIPHLREIQIDGKFKYFCSESDNFQTTKSDFPEIAKKFPDAFIVSIKDNHTKMVWKGGPKK